MWILAALLGALSGWALSSILQQRRYRRPAEWALRNPGKPWWLVATLAVTFGVLVATAEPATNILWLPLSVGLAWCAAVDFDVRRLPNNALAWCACWVALNWVAHCAQAGWRHGLLVLGVALLTGASFWVFHLVTKGGLGFGDVKLAALLAAALAINCIPAVLWALLGACLLALGFGLITRQSELAFGPWLSLAAVSCACVFP